MNRWLVVLCAAIALAIAATAHADRFEQGTGTFKQGLDRFGDSFTTAPGSVVTACGALQLDFTSNCNAVAMPLTVHLR